MYPDNPELVLPKRNVFTFRQEDCDRLMTDIGIMLEVPIKCGFVLEKFEKHDVKNQGFNLINTVRESIVVRFSKGKHIIDLSMQIPKLIDNQWFVINNRKKIPRYQLYDIPILTFFKDNEIRVQTNIGRIAINWKEKIKKFDFHVQISTFSKKIPLGIVLCAYYGPEFVKENFMPYDNIEQLRTVIGDNNITPYQLLQLDLFEICDVDTPVNQYIEFVGEYFSKRNPKAKGEDYIFTLTNILDIDIITKRFISEDKILDCLMNILENNTYYSDVDYVNKRIRCFEYIVLQHFINNIYKLCITNRNAPAPKYNVSSTKILGECNVSDIVQFDFCINPIDQLAQLTQTSLTGPNGFSKEAIPTRLKDLQVTMLGKICPIDTPDRENCGVIQNLNPTVKFDKKFQFEEEGYKKIIPSIAISMVPFLEHTDPTRLQMAAGQMKQSILLENFHIPYICSGAERQFSKYTNFITKAEEDGEVLCVTNKILVVGYNSGRIKIYNIGIRPIVSSNMNIIITDYKIGEKFNKHDTICYSTFCKNDVITIGQNFKIAFMSYYGFNNEDGIVISDRLQNDDSLTSVHYIDMSFNITSSKVLLDLNEDNKNLEYMPLYPIGSLLKKGNIYAKIKEMNLFGSIKNDSYNIFQECTEKIAGYDILIEDVKLFANDWYKDIKEYDNWVENQIQNQIDKNDKIIQIIADNTDLENGKKIVAENKLDLMHHPGKYKNKDELLKGMKIEINGVYTKKIAVGDKLANRHGNKGVITSIVPHEKMPQLPDGSHIDICLNPMGVISRMNMGQLFEISLSQSLIDLKTKIITMIDTKISQLKIRKFLINYIDMTDKTPTKWIVKHVTNNMPKIINKKYIESIYLIQPQFDSINRDDILKIMTYTNSSFENKLFDPISNTFIKNKIANGYMYLMKLTHRAENKLAYRSIGITSKKTMQPVSGKRNNGGQKCGEMESGCYVSNDMPLNHLECYTTKSDCVDIKNNFLKRAIGTEYLNIEEFPDNEPETLKLLKANLFVLGIDIEGELQDEV